MEFLFYQKRKKATGNSRKFFFEPKIASFEKKPKFYFQFRKLEGKGFFLFLSFFLSFHFFVGKKSFRDCRGSIKNSVFAMLQSQSKNQGLKKGNCVGESVGRSESERESESAWLRACVSVSAHVKERVRERKMCLSEIKKKRKRERGREE